MFPHLSLALIFIDVYHDVFGRHLGWKHLEPTLRSNEGATRGEGKSVELSLVRPTFPLARRLIGEPLTVGVLPSGSPRGIPRRVVMSRDLSRSERDGARNTRI